MPLPNYRILAAISGSRNGPFCTDHADHGIIPNRRHTPSGAFSTAHKKGECSQCCAAIGIYAVSRGLCCSCANSPFTKFRLVSTSTQVQVAAQSHRQNEHGPKADQIPTKEIC